VVTPLAPSAGQGSAGKGRKGPGGDGGSWATRADGGQKCGALGITGQPLPSACAVARLGGARGAAAAPRCSGPSSARSWFNQESPKGHQMTRSAIKLESPDAINLPLAITTKSHIEINICNTSSVSQSMTAL